MKKILFFVCLLFACGTMQAQQQHRPFWYQRASLFEELPVGPKDIVFLGNSITNGCEWSELFGDARVKNRGISADTAAGILERIDVILSGHPAKIFMMIGTNDIARGYSLDDIVKDIAAVIERIHAESPSTRVYVQSVLPVSDYYGNMHGHISHGEDIVALNVRLQTLCGQTGCVYIDLHTPFCDGEGKLKADYSNDGLHLMGKGYLLWRDIVQPYVREKVRRTANAKR